MRITSVLASALILSTCFLASAKEAKEASKSVLDKRASIDADAQKALDELTSKQPHSKTIMEKAYGWAAFDATKAAFVVSGGGGTGVAVEKESAKRTYMKMGTGGVGIGLGVQNMRIVFFFETKDAFDKFVISGWQAQAGATAAAGNEGANAEATFSNGMAYWVLTDKGFMLNADIAGTKYFKNDKLN